MCNVVPFTTRSATVRLDRDWRYTAATHEALAMLQTSSEELLGTVVWTRYPQVVGSPLAALMQDVMARRIDGHIRTMDRADHTKDVIAHARPLPDGGIDVTWRMVARVSGEPSEKLA